MPAGMWLDKDMEATTIIGKKVRGRPFGCSRRVTGTIVGIYGGGWIVRVQTLPDRNDHTRIVLIDIDEIEEVA